MFDFASIPSPVILPGSDRTAYRDPAVYYKDGTFYLFCTYVECHEDGPFMTVVQTLSDDLIHWSTPRELTVRDRRLNFSSPGNVIFFQGMYYLCLQTYCRENGEKYGNSRSRLWTMRSADLLHWEEPRLLRVKGNIPEEEMGRMIDPYLIEDRLNPGKCWCLYKQNGVSMSYSTDLENWTFSGHTECGENVCVLADEEGYRIFHSPRNGIGVLYTEDFVRFRVEVKLITLGQKQCPWAQGRLTAGFVLDLRSDPNFGKYILFFHGSGPEDEETVFDCNASIGIAWSDDLQLWEYPGKEDRDA